MCGIVGFWGAGLELEPSIIAMRDQLAHRGPDDSGHWFDSNIGLAMGQRRLSILDLSLAGHQPMLSSCGRYVLVYNGEIYNHVELRKELESFDTGLVLRGHSDTETILLAICYWGLEDTLIRLNGMFAFALWDTVDRKLTLARDRLGEKPLYYGFHRGAFFFSSELKALKANSNFRPEINMGSLELLMRYGYVPTPYSIYEGINKLPPAHYVTVDDYLASQVKPVCYWSLSEIISDSSINRTNCDDSVYLEELKVHLKAAVKCRMISDVPLGAFLSGGYDSTAIVAMMQEQSSSPIKTFSIGFNEAAYNEAPYAKAIANHLGTDHNELIVTPEEAMAVIPRLPQIYDEPFADSSQIPTCLVSELARSEVKVALSGDGGDELFGGYNRYTIGYNLWNNLSHVPIKVRKGVARFIASCPNEILDALAIILPTSVRGNNFSNRISKLVKVLEQSDSIDFYNVLVTHGNESLLLASDILVPSTIIERQKDFPALNDFRELMMYLDIKSYLPDDILTKLDRASMASSLEARSPFLDHKLVEFACKMPVTLKFREGRGKWLLRETLHRVVPEKLLDRAKMGFGVPIDNWLKDPLRDWAEALLSPERLERDGLFRSDVVRKIWGEYLSGRNSSHSQIWSVLMFQAWLSDHKG